MRSSERVWAKSVLITSVLAALSGGYHPARARPDAAATTRQPPQAADHAGCIAGSVVLVTLDGVRWQEIFHGVDHALARRQHIPVAARVDAAQLVPNLTRLGSTQGAALGGPALGAGIEASGPSFVSLPGYIELFTGRTDTACNDNDCGRVRMPTLSDEIAQAGCGTPVVFSSWSGIDNATSSAAKSVSTSAGRVAGNRAQLERIPEVAALLRAAEREPAEAGEEDFRSDQSTGELALAYLRASRPRFAFVGLGETDEYAHQNDYPKYLDALHRADALIGRIAQLVLERNAHGEPTTLIVTTDHGRADGFTSHGARYPESARVWLVAAGAGIRARGLVGSSKTRYLADVAPTIRSLLGMRAPGLGRAGEPLTELLSGPAWNASALCRVSQADARAR